MAWREVKATKEREFDAWSEVPWQITTIPHCADTAQTMSHEMSRCHVILCTLGTEESVASALDVSMRSLSESLSTTSLNQGGGAGTKGRPGNMKHHSSSCRAFMHQCQIMSQNVSIYDYWNHIRNHILSLSCDIICWECADIAPSLRRVMCDVTAPGAFLHRCSAGPLLGCFE